MKMWNAPVMQELDVKLTASSGLPSNTEQAGFIQNGWNEPTYDSAIWEDNGDCVIKKKDAAES